MSGPTPAYRPDATTLYRGPRPLVAGTARWSNRTERLHRDPEMHQLVYGHWFRADAPVSHLQRTVLLQRQLGTPSSIVRITGTAALKLLNLPDGDHYKWANRIFAHPEPPRGGELRHHQKRVHQLSWDGDRRRTSLDDVKLTKSYGLNSFQGPWESVLVHPIEALVVAAPMMDRWSITAALDAMLCSDRLERVGASDPEVFTVESIREALALLPPASRAVREVHRALADIQYPTWSAMETLTRMLALACGIPRPIMNFRVETPKGHSILDSAWPEHMTAVEFNGRDHSQDHATYKDEMYRNEVLRDLGWKLRIVSFDDLRVMGRLAEWLTWLGGHLGVEPDLSRVIGRTIEPFEPW